MTSPALLLLMPLVAVSFGYEPSSDSETGYDYTVQVEPELLEQMRRGQATDIEANIPDEVTPIRRIRIVVGNGPLPKRLRSRPVKQITFKQDTDPAIVPSFDLLAQTGPAGGFGRSATGFNTPQPRAAATPAPSSSTTVPSIGTQYPQPTSTVQSQLDAGFQAAETGLANTSSAVTNTATSMQASGQEVIDFARQNLGEFVAPTESQAAAARAAQPTITSTGSPPVPSTGGFDSSRYGAPASAAPAPAAVGPGETSLLNQARPSTRPQAGGLTQAEREYLNRIDRDRQLQQQQQAALASQRKAAARGSAFPDQPTVPNRVDDVVAPLGRAPNVTETAAAGFSGGPVIPSPNTGDRPWNAIEGANPKNAEASTNDTALPSIPSVRHTAAHTKEDDALWPDEQELDKEASATQPSTPSSTLVWLLGWTIAVGSVATNLFQWLNIVDMRNKYRVALRRNSPNFSRSMAA